MDPGMPRAQFGSQPRHVDLPDDGTGVQVQRRRRPREATFES